MNVHLNKLLCKGCQYCVEFCPQGILCMGKERNAKGFFTPVLTQEEKCTACAVCARVCPEGALEITKDE